MPAIGDPLADVAFEIVDVETVGPEARGRRRPPESIAIAGEGIAPASPGRRAVAAAGEVAGPGLRRLVAPRETTGLAAARGIFEFGLAGQAVALAAALGQPPRIGLGVLGADVQHRHGVVGDPAQIVVAPVHAAAADEIAAAFVVHQRMPATHRTRAMAADLHEAAELGDGDFGAGDGETAVEAHVARRPLGVAGVRLAVARAHPEAAVRHHHHLRAAPAAAQRVGEALAGTQQAVMRGQIDAIAQFRGRRIAGPGDTQDFGQPLPRPRQVIRALRFAQEGQAFVAQAGDLRLADRFHPLAAGGRGFQAGPHRLRPGQPAHRVLEIAAHGRILGAADQRALHRGDALAGTRLAGFQRQHVAEQRQRTFHGSVGVRRVPKATFGKGRFGLLVQFPQAICMIEAGNERHAALHPRQSDAAHHRRGRMCTPQRLGIVAGLRQRRVAGFDQCRQCAGQPGFRPGVVGVPLQQRQIKRNGRIGVFVQPALGHRRRSALAHGRHVGLDQFDLRAAPGQAIGDGVVAAHRHLPIAARPWRGAVLVFRGAIIATAAAQQHQRRQNARRPCPLCRAQRQSPLRLWCSSAVVTLSYRSRRAMTRGRLR